MPSKLQDTMEHLRSESVENAKDAERWAAFLRTASNNYKYSFNDQVLIHSQKPDATACAELEFWNSRMRRWINKGTKGIALVDYSGRVPRLRYVFDVSDTHSRYGNEVHLWSAKERFHDDIITALEDSFGELADKTDFSGAVISAAKNLVEDNIQDYLSDLNSDGMNEAFRAAVLASTQYMMLSRCGIDVPETRFSEAFGLVSAFTDTDALSALGSAVSDIAEMGLREIESTVRDLQLNEKNANRTFANQNDRRYDEAVIIQSKERSIDHESDIHTEGRLFDPESDIAGGLQTAGQVRNAEKDVSETEPQSPVQQDGNGGHPLGSSERNRSVSKRNDGKTDEGNGSELWSDRDPESYGPDALGSDDEQYQELGGGDRSEGTRLQLSGHDFNHPDDVPYFSEDNEKSELLRNCLALKDHRLEIAVFFAGHEDREERGDFVKSFFDNTYVEHILESGQRVGYRAYDDLLNLWRGRYPTREKEVFMYWRQAASNIYGQILMGRWLTPNERLMLNDEHAASLFGGTYTAADNQLDVPQAAIDYVLRGGSGYNEGKFRVYEQFLKKEGTEANAVFLRNEYGTGGHSDAIPGTDLWEEHDGKGLRIETLHKDRPDSVSVLLPWNKVAKRIDELIAANRYLSRIERARYPDYVAAQESRGQRAKISKAFMDVVRDFNDYREQLHDDESKLDSFMLNGLARMFASGQRKATGYRDHPDIYVLPAMRGALNAIIAEDTHLTGRCRDILDSLSGDLVKTFEPTYDELNPPPEPERRLVLSLGDTVYIGADEYELLSYGEETVELFDPGFPLFHQEFPREEFDRKVRENPLNDKYLRIVQSEIEEEQLTDEELDSLPVSTVENGEVVTYPNAEAMLDAQESSPKSNSFYDEYTGIKEEYPDSLLLYQVGDFYEAFGGDAERMASELDLVLTSRGLPDGSRIPMCGVPYHILETYTDKLLESGIDVAVSSLENGERKTVFLTSTDRDETVQPATEEEASVTEKEQLAPPHPVRQMKEAPHVLYPEIKSDYRTNYRIERDDIGVGTPLDRFHNNIRSIQLLKKLESEHRLANSYEQGFFADYVGWGGLSEFFREDNPHYGELKAALTDEEYAAARESTLTAFYTPPVVIKAMYKVLENMNFRNGNILEPSCGVGSFMGLLPDSMSGSKFYGVELDPVSGRMAQQLYQKNSIAVQGYESTNIPDSFFDAAVGNVPFGQIKVNDRRYNRHNFFIHDYFFARTLDKVRPGGIIAFITSSGTMDKESPKVRKYISQRAELLGAIRLPNNAFKDAAGTEVTADILFLQKRDRLVDIEPDWVHLGKDENGIVMNQYFIDNPDMIMGEMRMISGPYGPAPACVPYEDQSLADLLDAAVQNIHGEFSEADISDPEADEDELSIPADPEVRNFSYTVVDGEIYYRANSRMNHVEVSDTAKNRIKGLIGIRESVRRLIELQTEDYPDEDIQAEQKKLNELYDSFSKKYGLINSRGNNAAFSSDSSYCLLASLEVIDDDGNFVRKADMFTKRTIRQKVIVQSVDTASEALALSLAEKTKVDMEYMSSLTGRTEEELYDELRNVIFLNPLYTDGHDGQNKYLPADEYLSGNVRQKLETAKKYAESDQMYSVNVDALEAVQPEDLTAAEISVRLGSTWIPPEIVEQFMFELLETPRYMTWNIHVRFSKHTGEWQVEGKSYDKRNLRASNTFGTDRINAYRIIEETLNLKDVRIFDYPVDEMGKKHPVLNKKETAFAQGKQELIKEAFQNWIWKDPNRRDRLCRMYNEKFNSVRPRTYDGSHLNFVGMNPEITLRKHQLDGVAHAIYGGNELLAHEVGAGKTYTMVAIAQESKRLGLCQKSLFVVPNHLISQWASEYLQLYPAANILVATKKDFETKNRKKFCARIATGDYDAVIIGHSQFEKIPMSVERQQNILQQQLDEILNGIVEAKANRGDRFSVKKLEQMKKSVELKLQKLNDTSRKDDLVTFEELGVDRLFVDEAHYYKNLAAFTKMRNVGGISQTEAMKSSDLYMKCRYLDELTGGKGVVFATGTPVSNSMVEMYTMQKYLQYGTLSRNDLLHFDSWASTFGQTVTAIELSPEGSGYRAKTRFAKFFNLPELMTMFREVADIQTADMLKLPVPKAIFHNVVLKPSEQQKEMVAALGQRAERVRSKMVSSDEDNMLLITNDGRKLALDQRLMNDSLPDSETGKAAACAKNVFDIWQKTMPESSTQMVFCDLSTPHGDGKFNVYDDLKKKLVVMGIPEEQIAYIHDANSENQKKELFGKVRNGTVRVLIGSTFKMGAGTNVQKRLIALHHLDTPWRPADLAQRNGRIIRQGNDNPEVDIFTYVTENTFDSYLYQLVENKQKFIGQIMTSKSPVRSAEDVDEQALSYAEIKMLATGNPYIKEKMDLDIEVAKLKLLKSNHLSQKYSLEDKILKEFPKRIASLKQRIEGIALDIDHTEKCSIPNEDGFCSMTIRGTVFTEKKDAGSEILAVCKSMTSPDPVPLGNYRGFDMSLSFDSFSKNYVIALKSRCTYNVPLGTDIFGNIQRLDNTIAALPDKLKAAKEQLETTERQLETAKKDVEIPFPHEEELTRKSARLAELDAMLSLDKSENEIVDSDKDGDGSPETTDKNRDAPRER